MIGKTEIALIKKELIESRIGVMIAPLFLIALFFLIMILQGVFTGHLEKVFAPQDYQVVAFGGISIFMFFYALVILFFYYANSFSGDRKNNCMLFWKSMPVSDFKILSLKFINGTLVMPVIFVAWVLVAACASYFVGLIGFDQISNYINPLSAFWIYARLTVIILIIAVLTALWVAPFYAWVAFLSVFFRKWSIALAFVIPFAAIAIEKIFHFTPTTDSYIGDFLANRLFLIADVDQWEALNKADGILEDDYDFGDGSEWHGFAELLFDDIYAGLWNFVQSVNWVSLIVGLIVSAIFVYLASEYRRKNIQG